MTEFNIEFLSHNRKPVCTPDPSFPNGKDIDAGREPQPTSPSVDAEKLSLEYYSKCSQEWLAQQCVKFEAALDERNQEIAALSAPRAPDTSPSVDGETLKSKVIEAADEQITAIHTAFGSPGDYGYESREGKALYELYKFQVELRAAIRQSLIDETRALSAPRVEPPSQPDTGVREAEVVRWRQRAAQAEAVLEFIVAGYDNQYINHVDFRVEVYKAALAALPPDAGDRK